jgi:hypothetical protein
MGTKVGAIGASMRTHSVALQVAGFAIDANVQRRIERCGGVDKDVADALEVLDGGNLAVLEHTRDEFFAAARDDEVDESAEPEHGADIVS